MRTNTGMSGFERRLRWSGERRWSNFPMIHLKWEKAAHQQNNNNNNSNKKMPPRGIFINLTFLMK